ncbi:acyltransferase [Marinilabilia sp.]|uniref:acyltransferase n=1 Tax=Marinilabilia sp. TaxID=2021252 RepID=UPI0025BE3B2A|nr:acyltransferase [Marinilabilia sp.]
MKNPFETGYYCEQDLKEIGFKSIGKNVRIARNCTIMGLENISIGNNVIIDAYCTIVAVKEGFLDVGSYVHIGGYCLLSAGDGIVFHDFSGLSQGVKVYSRTDDYSGNFLTNPTVPEQYIGLKRGLVEIMPYVVVGAQSVILPGVNIGEGSSVGALTLVSRSLPEWGIFLGNPLRRIGDRSKDLLKFRNQLLGSHKGL